MKHALVLGASGAIGLGLSKHLASQGWQVRAFSLEWDSEASAALAADPRIEQIEGSIFEKDALDKALIGVTHVFNFISFSVPSTSPAFAEIEVNQTLRGMDTVLSAMVRAKVSNLIYPSSGGTIYGDTGGVPACENFPLRAISSYGAGKILAEELIKFYGRAHGLHYRIMRISNIYGYPVTRRVSQGVIDIFLNKLRNDQDLEIWGPDTIVRDYLFIDDLFDATSALLQLPDGDDLTVNVGTGCGVTLERIVQVLAEVTGKTPRVHCKSSHYAGIQYNVLNCSLLERMTGWLPRHSLEAGVGKLWRSLACAGPDNK